MSKKKQVVLKSFEELSEYKYGKRDTPKRNKFEKEYRKFAKSTQSVDK